MYTVEEVVSRLLAGNARFASGLRSVDSLASVQRLTELAENGQKPFASVLSCADSRGPSELIFDCGVGDLFVCRLAGNVATSGVIASFEYSVLKLGTPVILVMGHSRCGAVEAALSEPDSLPSRHLRDLVGDISRAGDIDAASRLNVEQQRGKLLEGSPILREHATVLGAFYDLSTGKVELIGKEAIV